jgi:cobalt-zinc-cadmium efflux system membrane fusion protein
LLQEQNHKNNLREGILAMRLNCYAAMLVVALIAGCDKTAKTEAVPEAKVDGETITFPQGSPQLASLTSQAAIERAAAALVLNGRLIWNEDKTVRIYTPFAGRVGRILVQPGEKVQAGQTLAVIASPDFGQAQADARRAQGDYALAKQNLARVRDLHEHGVVAAKDLNTTEADYARADSELQRTQARLKLYGGGTQVDQSYALRSPLGGVVVEKNINPGQELRPDQMGAGVPALFVITDPDYLWVLLDAAEKDLPHLKVGKLIKIRAPAYPDAAFDAKITAVSDFLDPTTRTIKVRADLSNAQRMLKGEMYVTASVNGATGMMLQVPTRAVFFQGGRHFVFADGGGGKFVRQEVKIGDSSEVNITIISGLQSGQKVVSEGALLLQQMLQPRRVVN